MSYLAEVKLGRVFLLGQLDAAVALYGPIPSGAALGGGLRIHLGSKDTWRILAAARGGLAGAGQTLFGAYTAAAGIEWFYQ